MGMRPIAALPILALAAFCGAAHAVIPSLLDPPADAESIGHGYAARAEMESARAEAAARNLRIRERRERGLYRPNLVVGPVLALGYLGFNAPGRETDYGDKALTGVALAMRSHYGKGLGLQASLELATSPAQETRAVTAEAKHLFGPWARFQLEPTLGYTRAWNRFEAGQWGGTYIGHHESANVGMDFTVYLGNRLQVPFSFGFRGALAGESLARAHMKLGYALPLD